jgi:chromosome condensin MukBEF ATPase and DNA-binding subunit MukB
MAEKSKFWEKIMKIAPLALAWLKSKNPLPRVIDQTSNKFKEAGKELITDAQQKLDDSCAKVMREFDDILGRHRLEAEKQIARLLWLSFALLSVVGVLLLGIAFVLFRVI